MASIAPEIERAYNFQLLTCILPRDGLCRLLGLVAQIVQVQRDAFLFFAEDHGPGFIGLQWVVVNRSGGRRHVTLDPL